MKHQAPPVPSEVYYYNKWKSNAHGALIALVLIIVSVVWSIVAGLFYGSVGWCVGLACSAVFWTFVAVTRFRDSDYYYDRYLSAAVDPSILDTEHTCE